MSDIELYYARTGNSLRAAVACAVEYAGAQLK